MTELRAGTLAANDATRGAHAPQYTRLFASPATTRRSSTNAPQRAGATEDGDEPPGEPNYTPPLAFFDPAFLQKNMGPQAADFVSAIGKLWYTPPPGGLGSCPTKRS
jgi:hypothetical protein